MTKKEFMKLTDYMVDTYGVYSHKNSEEDDLWFECPACIEPIVFEDWADDEGFINGYCPICGERIMED